MAESPYSISASLSVGYSNSSVAVWGPSTSQGTAALIVDQDWSYNTLNLSLSQTAGITGGIVTFQGSYDGSSWFSMQGFTPGTLEAVGPTYALQASSYATFQFGLTGIPYFRVVLSTAISGTGSVTVGYAADSFVNNVGAAQAGNWIVEQANDVGRVFMSFVIDQASGTTSESLFSMTINRAGTITNATSYTVTPGKTLRLQCKSTSLKETNSTVQDLNTYLRWAPSGLVSISSPILAHTYIGTSAGNTGEVATTSKSFPDGLEIPGGTQIGVSAKTSTNNTKISVCLIGYEY